MTDSVSWEIVAATNITALILYGCSFKHIAFEMQQITD